MKLKDLLKDVLPKEKLKFVPKSYEIIGSRSGAVAIVEIPEELTGFEKEIGKAIIKLNKNVRLVLKKVSGREGELRLRRFEVIAGSGKTEVIHVEHGYKLLLDPTKVYFSPREATERQRVAEQVKPGEVVMVMFSGVAPYAIAIAKKQPKVKLVVAIELNEHAHLYALKNVELNKLQGKVLPVLGDVREKAKEWYGKCDRVVMPLPKGAYQFLDEAISCLKQSGGVIHFYHWAREDDLFGEAEKLVKDVAKRHGFKVRFLSKRKVLPYAPRVWKVCLDCLLEPMGNKEIDEDR